MGTLLHAYRVIFIKILNVKHGYLKGKKGKEIHGELADVYGSSAPFYTQVKVWVGESKCGITSLENKVRSGRPLDVTDEEMCKEVRDLVYSERRIYVEEIAQALSFHMVAFQQSYMTV